MPTLAHRGMAMACGAVMLAAATAFAQVPTRISGSLAGMDAFETDTVTFSCDGENPCVGNFQLRAKFAECNNAITFADVITITGLSLAAPGPISGSMRFANAAFDVDGHNGVCTSSPPTGDVVFTFTGTWNGTTASIALSNGNISHIVTKPGKFCTLPIIPARSSTCPSANLFQHFSILPMTSYYFPTHPHAAHDESKFPVAMRALIEVHEIHINRAPGNITIKLRMQMQNWLL